MVQAGNWFQKEISGMSSLSEAAPSQRQRYAFGGAGKYDTVIAGALPVVAIPRFALKRQHVPVEWVVLHLADATGNLIDEMNS